MSNFFNFLVLSILIFICGFLLCVGAIIYSLINTKISKIIYTYFCIISSLAYSICLTLALLVKNIGFLQFIFGIFCGDLTFLTFYIFYYFLPKKIRGNIDLSCGEEWLNLSYILGLIEKVSRYDIPLLEQEFFNSFKDKIMRMTTYNCYEIPSSFELNRFYFLCERLGVK